MLSKCVPNFCKVMPTQSRSGCGDCVTSFCAMLEVAMPNFGCSPLMYVIQAIMQTILLISGVSITIMFISLINAPGPVPACICDINDYGLISGRVTPTEPGSLVTAGVLRLLGYGVGPVPVVDLSTTSKPSKFNIISSTASAPTTIIYTPVFSGQPLKIVGTGTASIRITPNPFVFPFDVVFGVAWNPTGGTNFVSITESFYRVVDSAPIIFSLPFARSITPADVAAGAGSVTFALFINIPVVAGTTFRSATFAITIEINEVH